jgi:hypothetical protein
MLALLLKYGVPVLLQVLQKTGFTNWAESLALKFGYEVIEEIEGVKTYSKRTDFPQTKNGTFANPPPAQGQANSNINQG